VSRYLSLTPGLTDAECLKAALRDLGYPVEERHGHLQGYRGDQRAEVADIKVARRHLGGASNDLGFRWDESRGEYALVISEFDRTYLRSGRFVDELMRKYAEHRVRKTLDAMGYQVTQEDQGAGTLKLVASRRGAAPPNVVESVGGRH
jgi:Protein of unknown function (DUF1257)